ncbi:pentatricopeptide repeat-containing protein At1g06710, mitochondrial [Carica papaya]|uniref:pentatricopeptide repeat-containing protein At1g06710, mitochondrial n=1 Tax=Carica papaya TaxID=3649 RepID=UPI000B8CA481|nr:pentatricopeptide repeat-containing protein At1g06710, mitochondrial [Carica papaya]
MNKRLLRCLLSQSISPLSSKPNLTCDSSSAFPCTINISQHNRKVSRQYIITVISRFLSTSLGSERQGLVGPNDPYLQDNTRIGSFSAEEFVILHDSLLDSGAGSSSTVPEAESSKSSNDAVSIANVILTEDDVFGNKTQKFLRQFRENLTEKLVVEVLSFLRRPDLAVKFFIWAGRQIGYCHTGPVYNALLEILERDDKDRLPEHFLQEIRTDDKEVLGKLLNGLIRKCCRNGLWNVALEELGRLKDFGYKPSRSTYNALIQVFVKADRLDTAYLVHREMSDAGFSMDGFTLGCFVHCLCKAGRWREALTLIEKEEFVPDTVIYTKMIFGLCEASLFKEAMDFLDRMRASSCLPNVVTYRILLIGHLRKRQLGSCKRILSTMIMEGCYPSPKIFNSLVHAYCRSGDYHFAYKLLKKMVNCGCQPGYVVYNILIGGICGNEELPGLDILDSRKWFDEMINVGCAPNVVTYTALIHAYLKARNFCSANELFEMMLSEGCIPNVVTYTALIDGYCKAGQIEKACKIYARMRASPEIPDVGMFFRFCNSDAEEPNVFTYGALVDGLCKVHKVKEAHELLDAMFVEGCEPNHIVYDALIDGFCKVGKLDEAQEVFAKMSQHGYSPDIYTYSSLIDRLFKDKRLDLALKVLSKMLENSCAPNVVIYTEMIDGLCKVGKTDEAYKLMLMMEEKGCCPNVVTYTAMIDGFGKVGKMDKCLELLQQMGLKGCSPNFITYRVLINHCCVNGLLDEAYELLEEMKQTYWPKYMAGYCKVIEGFNKEFIASLGLLDEISTNDSAPIIPVYRILIDNFIRAGRLEVALELYEEVASFSPFLAAYTNIYNSLIEALFLAGKVDKAFQLFSDMINRGGNPDLHIFFHLIKGLVKISKWDEALLLLDSVCQMDIHLFQEEKTSHML